MDMLDGLEAAVVPTRAALPVAARIQVVKDIRELALEQVGKRVSLCCMAPTFDKCSGPSQQRETDSSPLEEASVSTDPNMMKQRIPLQPLLRAVLVTMGGIAPVKNTPQGAFVTRNLQVQNGDSSKDKEKGKGREGAS